MDAIVGTRGASGNARTSASVTPPSAFATLRCGRNAGLVVALGGDGRGVPTDRGQLRVGGRRRRGRHQPRAARTVPDISRDGGCAIQRVEREWRS